MPKLDFLGKEEVENLVLSVPFHELKFDSKKSLGDTSLDGNLIIHGDNLLALKALLPYYAERVNCVYIDPPYNTGTEGWTRAKGWTGKGWCYNDKMNSPLMKEWLGNTVDRDDQSRHDKWLCMMWPRLSLLRDLLADDGVIFISCDDNEVHHLRMIMDEIFGEENFCEMFVWNNTSTPPSLSKISRKNVEYIICYAKEIYNVGKFFGRLLDNLDAALINKGNNLRILKFPKGKVKFNILNGIFRPGVKADKVKLLTDISIKNRFNENDFEMEAEFSWSQETLNKEILKETKFLVKSEKFSIRYKRIANNKFMSPNKYFDNEFLSIKAGVGTNEEARKLIQSIDIGFSYPKPITLVKYFVRTVSKKESIILDSFAGSGTTAHAVLDLNKEDSGNRKFILVECEDYADNITAERVRRVIKGVSNTRDEIKKSLSNQFSYVKLGNAIDYDKILKGEQLPDYNSLAALLFRQATNISLKEINQDIKTWFVGESEDYRVYVIYKPDIQFLQSSEAMLTEELLDKIYANLGKNQEAVIFASGRYIDFNAMKRTRVLFCYLPHEIQERVR